MPDAGPKGDVSDWLDENPKQHDKPALIDILDSFELWTEQPQQEGGSATVAMAVPEFPAEVLPPNVRAYCLSAARSIGVPVEMIAFPLMAFFGSLIGNRLSIQLKAGYRQYATLFVGIVAPPGAAKSPALNAARWPLDRLQEEATDAHKRAIVGYEADVEEWQAKPKGERGEKPARPDPRHYYTTDATLEALTSMLAGGHGLAVVRDELVSWISSLDQYRSGGKGSDRQQYLSLWAHAPIKQDRRTGEPIYIPRPVACVVGGIQPDFLSTLHDRDGRRDGFVERVILIRPDLKPTLWTDEELDISLLEPIVELFKSIDRDLDRDDENPWSGDRDVMKLHPDSRTLWVDWYNENARLVDQASGLRSGFYAKLPNQAARLALVLNAMWNPSNPTVLVSHARLADALELAEYIRAHLHRVLPLIGDVSASAAGGTGMRIHRILMNADLQDADGWVTRRDIMQKLGNVLADDLTQALADLAEASIIETRTIPTAPKPREEWRIVNADRVPHIPDDGDDWEEF
jgi:hypothetical protein